MEVVECVRRLIDGESMGDLVPYNTQFKGKTDFDGVDSTYTGLFEVDPEHRAIIITELAPKVWTSQYVEISAVQPSSSALFGSDPASSSARAHRS